MITFKRLLPELKSSFCFQFDLQGRWLLCRGRLRLELPRNLDQPLDSVLTSRESKRLLMESPFSGWLGPCPALKNNNPIKKPIVQQNLIIFGIQQLRQTSCKSNCSWRALWYLAGNSWTGQFGDFRSFLKIEYEKYEFTNNVQSP